MENLSTGELSSLHHNLTWNPRNLNLKDESPPDIGNTKRTGFTLDSRLLVLSLDSPLTLRLCYDFYFIKIYKEFRRVLSNNWDGKKVYKYLKLIIRWFIRPFFFNGESWWGRGVMASQIIVVISINVSQQFQRIRHCVKSR